MKKLKKIMSYMCISIICMLNTVHAKEKTNIINDDDISLLLAGDIMLGSNDKFITPKLFGDSLEQLRNPYDILFFNFEGTTGEIGMDNKTPKCTQGIYCFTFMSPLSSLKIFNELKNPQSKLVFNLANNHSKDFGDRVQKLTYNALSQYGYPIGYEDFPTKEMIVKNKQMVFIGASPHMGSLSIFSNKLNKLVKYYKEKNYIIIVSLHMGAEGNDKYWVKDNNEYFAGQNRGNIYQLSHQLVDDGADLIVGHGPHIIRGIEKYKGKPIIYSLGNFLTYGTFNLKGNAAMSVLISVNLEQDGKFKIGKIYGYEQTKNTNPLLWQNGVALKQDNTVIDWIKNLSEKNFKETFMFDKLNQFK